MDAQELNDEWTDGETSGMDNKRLQLLREDIMHVTGLTVPRRLPALESWQKRMKGQVTRKLREAAEGGDVPEAETSGLLPDDERGVRTGSGSSSDSESGSDSAPESEPESESGSGGEGNTSGGGDEPSDEDATSADADDANAEG
jgi:hypothetical protein